MDRNKNLETLLIIVTGLLIIYLIRPWNPLLFAAAALGLAAIISNVAASWITWFWYKIADILGRFIPKIILLLVFYLFLFPISLLYRFFSVKNKRIYSKGSDSLWIIRNHTYVPDDIIKLW